ncbi:hypothetical protein [Croceivirga sp. JEA036]|uniref:hypothetical protein n=1 Tax=Croceivirga sp. JEA036 TaxID=2721162 RepID=UPI00143BE11C|nr:hypothetical protein [Croceivirga sp. JEA036]NJB36602.1 hypothetical protein [Croceivirga sp. JEA036]
MLLFLNVLLAHSLKAQDKIPTSFYAEVTGFYEDQFDGLYLQFDLGTELFRYKWIAPDLSVNLLYGSVSDENFDDRNRDGEIDFRSFDSQSFVAWNAAFGAKFIIDDDTGQFIILPKYHFGKQEATGEYSNTDGIASKTRAFTSNSHWSLSAGYEFLHPKYYNKFGVYLRYTRFNAGKSLNHLNPENQVYHRTNFNTPAIGITLRFSTSFSKKVRASY